MGELEDALMEAHMAQLDAEQFRVALLAALGFHGRPSDDTIIAFAVEKINHANRFSPENPTGAPTTTEET